MREKSKAETVNWRNPKDHELLALIIDQKRDAGHQTNHYATKAVKRIIAPTPSKTNQNKHKKNKRRVKALAKQQSLDKVAERQSFYFEDSRKPLFNHRLHDATKPRAAC